MIKISIITPVYNSAHLIGQTIKSVLEQSYQHWELIIVNDGSTDDITEVVQPYAETDERIKLYHQQNAGASAARNTGIKKANFEWLLFLDADDWIREDYFTKMVAVLEHDPSVNVVHCGWTRIRKDGVFAKEVYGGPQTDMFPSLAYHCPFAIHSCIVQKKLAQAVGGFDTSFKTCGDWDFWQRIARTGARFQMVYEVMAFYRMRPHSLSSDGNQFCLNGLQVISQAYTNDIRVPDANPEYVNGLPTDDLAYRKYYFITWTAGLLIGAQKTASHLLQHVSEMPADNLDAETIAESLMDSAVIPGGKAQQDWPGHWFSIENFVEEYLKRLEEQSCSLTLCSRVIKLMQQKIAIVAAEEAGEFELGSVFAKQIDVELPVHNFHFSNAVEKFVGIIKVNEQVLGKIELPVFDHFMPAWIIKDAIAAKFAWFILQEYFALNVYPSLQLKDASKKNLSTQALHNEIGWKTFLQQIWERPEWTEAMFYDPFTKEKSKRVLEVNSSVLHVEIAEEIADIKTKASSLQIIYSAGGINIGTIKIATQKKLISAQALRFTINSSSAFELCIAVVREALIGQKLNDGLTLRQRLQQKRNERQVVNTQTFSFQTEMELPVNDSFILASRFNQKQETHCRRAVLPSEVYEQIYQQCQSAGEIGIKVQSHEPEHIFYMPEAIYANDSLQDQKLLFSSATLFQKILQRIKFSGSAAPKKNHAVKEQTNELLILNYCGVTPDNSKSSEELLTPEQFEEQLKYLSSNGYGSVNLEMWMQARKTNQQFSGKPVALVFHDSSLNFYEHAWPKLQKYSFHATVFVTTNNIEEESPNERNKTMNWAHIIELSKAGIQFGSAATSHVHLTSLSPVEMVKELTISRKVLQERLQCPVYLFSYPFNDCDDVVAHLVEACGYRIGVGAYAGVASYADSIFKLPNLDVKGTDTLEKFIVKIKSGYK